MLKPMKPGRNYMIINIDEPYAEQVYEILKAGQMAKGEWPEGDITFEEWKKLTFKDFYCESLKDGLCSTRDYGLNQYENPCYNCCFGCMHAVNMDCSFICSQVAEYYHQSEEEGL